MSNEYPCGIEQEGETYCVQYRNEDGDKWRHYYVDSNKTFALEMYAKHVSKYSKEQCRFVVITGTTQLFNYVPVDQQKDEEDE